MSGLEFEDMCGLLYPGLDRFGLTDTPIVRNEGVTTQYFCSDVDMTTIIGSKIWL
jgi:hypothetical protein